MRIRLREPESWLCPVTYVHRAEPRTVPYRHRFARFAAQTVVRFARFGGGTRAVRTVRMCRGSDGSAPRFWRSQRFDLPLGDICLCCAHLGKSGRGFEALTLGPEVCHGIAVNFDQAGIAKFDAGAQAWRRDSCSDHWRRSPQRGRCEPPQRTKWRGLCDLASRLSP